METFQGSCVQADLEARKRENGSTVYQALFLCVWLKISTIKKPKIDLMVYVNDITQKLKTIPLAAMWPVWRPLQYPNTPVETSR